MYQLRLHLLLPYILLYQNTSDYHCISFRNKLTAYCGASDQFDLKLDNAAFNAESKKKSKLFVKMMSSCLSEVDQMLAEVNVKLCEINVKMSRSFEVKPRRKLLPRVQMILTELEWIVEMSDDDDSDSSLSSCGSLSWDNFNERKCEMSDTEELSENLTDDDYEVSSIASISSSPSEQEEEESLEDVFQTITPTSPTKTQPTSLFNHSPLELVTISC